MSRSKIKLIFLLKGQVVQVKEVAIGENAIWVVGSQAGSADVCLQDSMISRAHLQLVVNGNGDLTVMDLGSTNGTFVNGERIAAHVGRRIGPGQKISLGQTGIGQIIFEGGNGENVQKETTSSQGLLALLNQKGELTIGRGQDCDVVIPTQTASRLHARLRKLPNGEIALTDLNSTNGTFVNGSRISGTVSLKSSDKVIIGRTLLELGKGPHQLGQEVAIRTLGIEKTFSNGKMGLQRTSLEIQSGEMVAIMGPSGCGKSTLLKCLTGESPATRGQVFLFDLELVQHYDYLKTLVGYVPQDDIVHRELTVDQALYYAAKLRMASPTAQQIEEKVSEVLSRLRISHIRHSRIGKISGGQRKRVSIAIELLTDPMILFLDEPTSPLDPQTIDEFLKILRSLAERGTTVVMVTHKPEDLEYMDTVLFLAEGGAMVYNGPADQYKTYFGVRTAVEVYAAICGDEAKPWISKFRSRSGEFGSPKTNPKLVHKSGKGVLGELYWLSLRYFRIKTNDPINLGILIGQAPIIAGLVCLIFGKLNLSVPFLVTLSAIWFGTSNAAREIVAEAAIYQRERMFNLRIGPYVLSKLGVLGFFAFIQSLLFSVIVYWGFSDSNPAWSHLGQTILWVWLLTLCATLLGLAISAVVDTAEKAMTLVPLVLIPQVMLAGVVSRIEGPVVELLSYASPSRWGNEGLCLIQDSLFDNRVEGLELELRQMSDSILPAENILKAQYYSLYEDIFPESAYTIQLDFIFLLILGLVFGGILVVALRRKDSI